MKKVFLILAMVVSPVLFANGADAAVQPQVSDTKAALEGLYRCYNRGGFVGSTKTNDYDYSDTSYYKNLSLINETGRNYEMPLPTGHYENDAVNCQDIMIGEEGSSSNLFPGLGSIFSFSIPGDDVLSLVGGEVGEFYESMGYKKEQKEVESTETTMCFNLPYSDNFVGAWPTGVLTLDEAKYTHYACIEVNKDTHVIKDGAEWHIIEGTAGDTFDTVYWTAESNEPGKYARLWLNVKHAFLGGWECFGLCVTTKGLYVATGSSSTIESFADTFYQRAVEIGSASYSSMSYYYPGEPKYYQPPVDEKQVVTTYDLLTPATDSAEIAIGSITSQAYQNYDALKFTPDQVFDLYMDYLKNYYNSGSATIYCGASESTEAAYYEGKVNTGEYIKFSVKTTSNPGEKACYASAPTKNKNKKVNGVNPSTMHFDGTLFSFDEMLAALDNMQIENELPDDYLVPPGTVDPDEGSGETDRCYSGAGVLGWIVCPVTSGLAKVGSAAYEWIEENFLQIRSSIFTDDNNGVREAWGTIRNIANIGFIIMLLIVIFSQITGVGIDNYGIKRILPKLIVGAIVMNLSYIICELAVDVSNIVGSGLKDLLSAMGPTLNAPTSSGDASLTQYLVVGGTGVLAAAGIMILSSGGLGAVLTLLIALLSVVISIIVLFVVLIVRQAGVVVCVVIAPIAILMYLLPNTEKFFKRWLDLMKGLLLVYPLCGLVIGAGDFIGKIFGNLAAGADSNLQMGFALSAMVVTAIPYLFIPTLLKSSLAAMGNLGAKISGLGARLRGGASGKVRNSNAMKNSKERAAEYRTRVKAGVDRNGNDKQLGKFRRALRGGKRGMARARAQYLRNQDTRNREDSLMNVGFQAAVIGQQKRAEKDEMADYMTLINNETRNGEDAEALYKMYDDYMAKGNKAGAVAVARIAGRRKDTAADFMSQKITGYDNKTGKISDAAAGYNPALLSSVMKEVATGENSGNYRTSTPMGFEFAAQYNREYDPNSAEAPEAKYSEWRNKSGNVDRALDNYVTNSQELMGIKNSSLGEMSRLIASGGVDPDKAARIQRLASEAIDNRGKTGIWDSTKAENIYKLAGREAEYRAMVNNAAGSVRGENAAAGAEASTMDVRAESAAQAQAPQVQQIQVQGQPVQAQTQSQVQPVQATGAAAQGSAIDLRALGDETLLDIATNPNARMDDTTRTAAEREYMRRVNAASQHTPPMERPQTPKVNPPEK